MQNKPTVLRGPHHAINLRTQRSWGRRIAMALFTLLYFAGSLIGFAVWDINSAIRSLSVDSLLGKDRPSASTSPQQPTDSFSGRPLNILLIGEDERPPGSRDENGRPLTGMRSDTTMLAHVSADRKRVDIVSVPRDLLVDIPACDLGNGKSTKAQRGQFNWAFAFGADGGGRQAAVACTIRTLEKLSSVLVDEWAIVDFDGFSTMVDALGGVNMCLDKPIKDLRYTGLQLPAGCQKLNGGQALGLARVRHGVGFDGSDTQRIGRQQQLVRAIMTEAFSKNILTNPASLYSFALASLKSVVVSENLGSVSRLTGLATSLGSLKKENIHFVSLPTKPYPADPNRVITTEAAEKVWDAIRADKPVPTNLVNIDGTGQAPPTPTPSATGSTPGGAPTPGGSKPRATPNPTGSGNGS